MEIDWITVSAQIVNFLILVWLLKRFLYQPVIRAMDQREQGIADRLNEAEEREQQADAQIRRYEDNTRELEQQRDDILATAKEEADQQKKQLLNQARDEVTETRQHWQRQANQEKEEFLNNLRGQASQVIQTIARKALTDLADADLEGQIVDKFLGQLTSLDKTAREALADTSDSIHIASAFELDATVRGRITRAVHDNIADGIDVAYIVSPELLCGIELTSGGRRLSWCLANYLEELTARIDEAFNSTESSKAEREKD
jgi:F-type H+-transporting ATPase subunit b